LEFDVFKRKAALLADEFFVSREVGGMVASVLELGCRPFHDELVALLLRSSLDRSEVERQAVVPVLLALESKGLLTPAQLARGFEKLVLSWGDLQLDVPGAPGLLVALLSSRVGLMDKSLFARLPQDMLTSVYGGLPMGPIKQTVQAHLTELLAFKLELSHMVENDLICARSSDTFVNWLKTQSKPAFHHEVVLAACMSSFKDTPSVTAYWTSCFDSAGLRAEKSRLIFALFTELHNNSGGCSLTDTDIQLGFSRLLGVVAGEDASTLSDSKLAHVASLLKLAVESDILPAQFLKAARRLRYGGPRGVEAVRMAQRQTPLHSRRVWGSGDARQFRAEVHDAIVEYFDSKSTEELALVVGELHLDGKQQSTFLRKLFVSGMERHDQGAALNATQTLLECCWSGQEVRDAFAELRDVAKDLVLDIPHIREQTAELVGMAVRRGLLDQTYLERDGSTNV
jgi:hypothetical protein